MLRTLFRVLRAVGDAKAAAKGPDAVAKRLVRRASHRRLSKLLRKL